MVFMQNFRTFNSHSEKVPAFRIPLKTAPLHAKYFTDQTHYLYRMALYSGPGRAMVLVMELFKLINRKSGIK